MNTHEAIQWVLQAVSGDESRPSITHAVSLNGHVVATDGHRLHLAKNAAPDGTEGLFHRCGEWVERSVDFPDYKQVLPDREYRQTVTVETMEATEGEPRYYRIVFTNGESGKYNATFFDQMMAYPGKKGLFVVEGSAQHDIGPILGRETNEILGMLMPVREA